MLEFALDALREATEENFEECIRQASEEISGALCWINRHLEFVHDSSITCRHPADGFLSKESYAAYRKKIPLELLERLSRPLEEGWDAHLKTKKEHEA
jgi:hypothetical protein